MLCLGRSFWFVDAGNGLHQIILGNVGRRERVHNLFGNAKNFRLFFPHQYRRGLNQAQYGKAYRAVFLLKLERSWTSGEANFRTLLRHLPAQSCREFTR